MAYERRKIQFFIHARRKSRALWGRLRQSRSSVRKPCAFASLAAIFRVISKELSGNLRRAFDALAGSLLDRPTYFATVLYEAMKGFGCHKETLTRVITSRADLDLADVARKFELKYKKSLAEMVKSEIGGKYQTFILKIMGHDNSVL